LNGRQKKRMASNPPERRPEVNMGSGPPGNRKLSPGNEPGAKYSLKGKTGKTKLVVSKTILIPEDDEKQGNMGDFEGWEPA